MDRMCLESLEPRTLLSVSLTSPIDSVTIDPMGSAVQIDLNDHFDTTTSISGTVVDLDSVLGHIYLELLDQTTPVTVANFLSYVTAGHYDSSFIHRLDPGFLIQSGSYNFINSEFGEVYRGSEIQNEFNVSNTRGTIAMAKRANMPNSATNGWFINLGNNALNLDNQNGGFTVFGNVIYNSMDVVDTIESLAYGDFTWLDTPLAGDFSELPVRNYTQSDYFAHADVNENNLVLFNSVSTVGSPSPLIYEVVSNNNEAVVTASVDYAGQLTLTPTGNGSGPATITVLATDRDGFTLDTTVEVFIPDPTGSDFNADGYDDIVFRNSTNGLNVIWLMQGANKIGSVGLPTVADNNWTIATVGDINKDAHPDIVWRNTSNGLNQVWTMNGSTKAGSVGLPTVADTDWTLVGLGDFNLDGYNDLVWRNTSTGGNIVWYMDGTNKIGSGALPTVTDTNWKLIDIADFNADNKVDLLWRNTSNGLNIIWTMNGTAKTGSVGLPTLGDTNWILAGAVDANMDGNFDLLWRNQSSGLTIVWTMNGTSKSGSLGLPTVSSVWQAVV
ncbi:MAG: hypothetical protein GC164_07565 [Phycisphaera sp.]|nr:hypothetical protein [Phycisphaera sp.]